MNETRLKPRPISAEQFAPFGDLIQASSSVVEAMNEARFERFNDMAKIDVDESGDGHVGISIARSKTPTRLPYRFDLLERHPLGSQAFIPLGDFSFVVVVAAPGESAEIADLQAFVTNGRQGINYHRGTWHMPLIALQGNQSFLIVDRVPGHDNCDQQVLSQAILLEAP